MHVLCFVIGSIIPLQWFLQQLPEGQRKLIFTEKKQGDDGSKGGGVINIAIRQLQEKFVFMKNLSTDIGDDSHQEAMISIFSFSNKTLHTELLRTIVKFCSTTGEHFRFAFVFILYIHFC